LAGGASPLRRGPRCDRCPSPVLVGISWAWPTPVLQGYLRPRAPGRPPSFLRCPHRAGGRPVIVRACATARPTRIPWPGRPPPPPTIAATRGSPAGPGDQDPVGYHAPGRFHRVDAVVDPAVLGERSSRRPGLEWVITLITAWAESPWPRPPWRGRAFTAAQLANHTASTTWSAPWSARPQAACGGVLPWPSLGCGGGLALMTIAAALSEEGCSPDHQANAMPHRAGKWVGLAFSMQRPCPLRPVHDRIAHLRDRRHPGRNGHDGRY